MQNTNIVKSAINVFLIIAVAVSLFQELNFTTTANPDQPQEPVPEINSNGTKVEGLTILATDKFHKSFKDLLIRIDYNIEIKEYPFEGEEYWVNLFLTHGHIMVVFFLVGKYQSEQDQARKTKLMGIGMVLVIAWMFLTPYIKPQRFALEYKGVKTLESEVFVEEDVLKMIGEYDDIAAFVIDDIQEAKKSARVAEEVIVEEPFEEE
ncbi:unnamed protein product [Sphagnum balticum]